MNDLKRDMAPRRDAAIADSAPEPGPSSHALHEASVGHLLRRAYQRALEISSQRLKEHQLTPRQGMAIVAIGAHGAMSQAELGQDIAMEPANVSGLVDRLKKKGLIAAERDRANPKRMRLTLTAAGRAIFEPLLDAKQDSEALILQELSEDERRQFIAALRKIIG